MCLNALSGRERGGEKGESKETVSQRDLLTGYLVC